MSTKKIDPANLKRVNGSFRDMSDHLRGNASDLIDSSATEKLQAATDSLKQLSKEMVGTIDSLDGYLGAVGEAFQNADNSIARAIGQSLYTKSPETRAERRERYIQEGKTSKDRHTRRKQVEISQSLYSDFP